MNKNTAVDIYNILKKQYPRAKIALKYSNNWELFVAVVLSAQCTDKRVNIVTEKLFSKYKQIADYACANLNEFEIDIRSTGFYKNKAKNIIASANKIIDEFEGKIPKTMDQILTLPGIARKSANVILGNAYQVVEGVAVDTHVRRLSQRLGLSKNSNPDKIETDLMKLYKKYKWFNLTYLLIEHGRAICDAKKPKCDQCVLNKICPSSFKFKHFN